MKLLNKIAVALFAVFTVLCSATQSFPVLAEEATELCDLVDIEKFDSCVRSQINAFEPRISISEFNIKATEENGELIRLYVWKEMADCFQVDKIACHDFAGKYTTLLVTYNYSSEEYNKMLAECKASAWDYVYDIVDSNLHDYEKALIIHDRMVARCEYDYKNYLNGTVPEESFSMYGVLVNKIAVCQGYAQAYGYLLDMVGIKSEYVSSKILNHAWNIVYIDDVPYHVDVTWDDRAWDVPGNVSHDNFLVSTKKLYNEGHRANDYNSSPTSTKFEEGFWNQSCGEVVCIDGVIYYIDNESEALRIRPSGKKLESVSGIWYASNTSFWRGNFSSLTSDGKSVYYSTPCDVYRYTPSTGETTKVYTKKNSKSFYSIYGIHFDGTKLICGVFHTPSFESNTVKKYGETVNAASIVDTECEYTAKYYDGETVVFEQSGKYGDVVQVSSFAPEKEGYVFKGWSTYPQGEVKYLGGEDLSLNSDVTLFAVWELKKYTVTYDLQGGTGVFSSQEKSHGADLAVAEELPGKKGHTFKGWCTSKDGTGEIYNAGSALTEDRNITLYALWEADTFEITVINGTEKTVITKLFDVDCALPRKIITKNGYVFLGYATSENGEAVYKLGDVYKENASITLWTVWEESKIYKFSYDLNGGTGDVPLDVVPILNRAYVSEYIPEKEGHKFVGWSFEKDGSPVCFGGERITYSRDITLYAVWAKEKSPWGYAVIIACLAGCVATLYFGIRWIKKA